MANIDGLLHLGAIATAVAIAYVGLDRIHWDDRRFERNLKAAEQDAASALIPYDIKDSEEYPRTVFDGLPFWTQVRLLTLCVIAKVRVHKRPLCLAAHTIHVQINFPMFMYFRDRWDRFVIRILAVISIVLFLLVTAIVTWEMESISLLPKCTAYWPIYSIDICAVVTSISVDTTVPYLYGYFACTLLWVCFTGASSQRLQNVRKRCAIIDGTISNTLDRLKQRLVSRWLKAPPSPQAPPQPAPAPNDPAPQ